MYKCLAAIDIGSNTVHLIVAGTYGSHITILADQSVFIRLADGVWNLGYIPEERIIATTQAILYLRDIARSFGAENLIVVATEVARAAGNTTALLNAIEATSGIHPLVLSGMDEATLMFRGVTHGRKLPINVGVADLGGGSLEIIISELGYGAWRTSMQVGSSFMRERFAIGDPPADEETGALQIYLQDVFGAVSRLSNIDEMLVCGGTVNALMRLTQQAQKRAVGDRVLRTDDIHNAIAIMRTKPAALIATEYHLRLERARLLPTGAMVLLALIERMHLPGIIVSEAGIREGIISSAAKYDDKWLEASRENAYNHNFSMDETAPRFYLQNHKNSLKTASQLTISAFAAQQIRKLVRAAQKLRKNVLRGDKDAIHDMRIILRKLKTCLMVYSACFPAQPQRAALRIIKRMADVLGRARDEDAAIITLQSMKPLMAPEAEAGWNFLLRKFQRKKRIALKNLPIAFSGKDFTGLVRQIDAMLKNTSPAISVEEIRIAETKKAQKAGS